MNEKLGHGVGGWSPSGAALYECLLSQVGTCPDITINDAKIYKLYIIDRKHNCVMLFLVILFNLL